MFFVVDDVGVVISVMGTPGDKSPVSKVVQEPFQSTTDSDDLAKEEKLIQTSGDMTVLRDIPSLGIFVEHGLEQASPPKDPLPEAKPINIQTLEELQKQLLVVTDVEPHFIEELSLPGPSGLQTPKAVKSITAVTPKRTKKPPVSAQTPKKPYLCSVCNKNFPTSTKLISHELIHAGSTPFKCEHCKKAFSSKFKLVRHMLIHSDRKPFSCTVCERTFHRKDHLKNHIKVHSPSKKVYVCEKTNCHKEYTSIMSYRKHLAMHSAEEGALDCKICLKTFETKAEILYHLKIHAGSRTVKNPNEKKFTCEFCDRKFFTRKDVRRHLVVHTGSRNFLCQFCPQRFGRKDHLVRHIKKSHAVSYSETETADGSAHKDETQTKSETKISTESSESITEYSTDSLDVKVSDSKLERFESMLFPQSFSDLSPMLCSETEDLRYLPDTSSESVKLELLPETGLPSDAELLTELVVMKEELEQRLEQPGPSSESPSLVPSEMIDEDILRLIGESSADLTDDDNNLPLPGFSQAFQQPPQPP